MRHGDEVPHGGAAQGGDVHAAGDGLAGEGADLGQGALDTVVNIFHHAGPELHAHGHAGGGDLGAGAKAGGLLVDLDGGSAAGHVQDLADQLLLANTYHIGDVSIFQTVRRHQRAGYFNNSTAQKILTFFP